MKSKARQKCDDYYFLDYFFRFCLPNAKKILADSSPLQNSTENAMTDIVTLANVNKLRRLVEQEQADRRRQTQDILELFKGIQATISQLAEQVKTLTTKVDGAQGTKAEADKYFKHLNYGGYDYGRGDYGREGPYNYCKCRKRHEEDCNCPVGSFK